MKAFDVYFVKYFHIVGRSVGFPTAAVTGSEKRRFPGHGFGFVYDVLQHRHIFNPSIRIDISV